MDELVRNAADTRQVKEGKVKEKIRHKQMNDSLNWMLSHRNGRRLFWGWLSDTGVFNTSFTGDNNHTNFNEGKRQMGLKMLKDLNKVKPEAYILMMKEAEEDQFVTKGKNNE